MLFLIIFRRDDPWSSRLKIKGETVTVPPSTESESLPMKEIGI